MTQVAAVVVVVAVDPVGISRPYRNDLMVSSRKHLVELHIQYLMLGWFNPI